MVEKKKNMSEQQPLIKPYSCYWHPHKSWTDLFVGAVLWLLFPLHKIAKLPALKDSEATTKKHESVRGMMKQGASASKYAVAKWATNSACAIIEFKYTIARRPLLKEWGLYEESLNGKKPSGGIEVIMRFPASILEQTKEIDTSKKNEFGCVVVENLDIKSFPADVPIILYFFGGGMTIGVPNDSDGLEMVQKLSKLASKKPFIHACVCYSQSPEHPFPVAVEEALTAVSQILASLPHRRIHLAGISAGGNLAAVATMEMQRRFPGRISSSTILCPMLNPAADTTSYYMNRNALSVSSEWLRWCWRAYLCLPRNNDSGDILKLDTMGARLEYGSNAASWKESPFNNGDIARLVNPTIEIPTGFDDPINGTEFVVLTNEGDALRDDGIELVDKLKSAGATVKYLRQGGTHWFGTSLDSTNHDAFVEAWKDVVFPDK